MAVLHTIEEHAHSAQWVLPNLAGPITATAAGGVWTYGAASAPLGTPGDDFDLHHMELVLINNADYQIQILVDGVPVFEDSVERIAASVRSFDRPVHMDVTAPGPITVKCATDIGGGTLTIKVKGHDY